MWGWIIGIILLLTILICLFFKGASMNDPNR